MTYMKTKEDSVYCSVEDALKELAAGRMIIVTDDEDRENEGDFFIPAARCTARHINLMATWGRGLICAPISGDVAERLKLSLMVPEGANALHGTAFTQSVDAIPGCASGISAADRAVTLQMLADSSTSPGELARPGHIFPILANPEGLAGRDGHTEAAVELCRLAGEPEAGVICEILVNDGSMARGSILEDMARAWDIPILTIQRLKEYILNKKKPVETVLPQSGEAVRTLYYPSEAAGCEAVVLIKDGWADSPIVRIHSECLTGDVLGSGRCDCGAQLKAAKRRILEEGGLLIYLRQEGRGIGLENKLRAYALQDKGCDTVEANTALGFPADMRDYSAAVMILKQLGISRVRLLTNNPDKISAIAGGGIDVEQLPLIVGYPDTAAVYMNTKKALMGHLL